jgi:hypothetical protein
VVRADLVEHPDLAGPLIRILVDVEILLGHGIDVSLGATFSDVYHLAADSDKPARIVRVLDADSDPRVSPHVFIFDPALSAVDDDVLAIEIDPHRAGVRRSVAHHGGEMGKGSLLEEVGKVLRVCLGHG